MEAASVEALVATLKDPNTEPRWYAMDALARLGPEAKGAVPAIIAALESKVNDETVKRTGAKALGLIGADAKPAIPVLTALLQSADPLQKVAAAVALWRITGEATHLRPVTEAIQVGPPEAAYAALLALEELGEPARAASKVVIGALGHADPDIRRAASSVLLSWGIDLAPPILATIAEPGRVQTLASLQLLGAMIEKTRREGVESNQLALPMRQQGAERIGREIVPALISRLDSGTAAERDAATQAIGKAGLVGVGPLLTSLTTATLSQRPAILAALAATERNLPQRPGQNLAEPLAAIRRDCLAPLTALLADADKPTRLAALRYFAALEYGCEATAAIPKLEAALKDEDVAVRSLAAESLDRIKK